jgi:putative endonuclease
MVQAAGAERRRWGDAAEDRAAVLLEAAGYRVLERNFQCREGELDIVAERDDVLCFVEVRMRSTAAWGDPALTVSRAKQRRVVRAALRYLFLHRIHGRALRFDVISVVGRGQDAKLEHIPDAFDAGM